MLSPKNRGLRQWKLFHANSRGILLFQNLFLKLLHYSLRLLKDWLSDGIRCALHEYNYYVIVTVSIFEKLCLLIVILAKMRKELL
jgi:hypothetical protein